jgi:hypothetical protein
MWIIARLKLQRDGLSYMERQRLQGRVSYCRRPTNRVSDGVFFANRVEGEPCELLV